MQRRGRLHFRRELEPRPMGEADRQRVRDLMDAAEALEMLERAAAAKRATEARNLARRLRSARRQDNE